MAFERSGRVARHATLLSSGHLDFDSLFRSGVGKHAMAIMAGTVAEELARRPRDGWVRRHSSEQLLTIHESGHATVATVFGMPVYAIRIIPDRSLVARLVDGTASYPEGFCQLQEASPTPEVELPEDSLAVRGLLSGLGRLMGGEDADDVVIQKALREQTKVVLRENWELLKDFSNALQFEKVLNVEQIKRIIALHPRAESAVAA
jgi:hypothetical protein